jgi:formate dehydrogenase-N alpha subunit
MTNHWIDYKNADVIMNIGGNTAENHPISMKWIEKARERGAKLIVVDPRITRTAAVADVYAPIRPGTNIAFLSGIINYALENKLYHEEYIKYYTNASSLINPEFSFHDGLFSGAKEVDGKIVYDKSTWSYQTDAEGNILKDETLENPNCVFQLMKKHFSRYDVDTVCSITGCPKDKFLEVADVYCSTGKPGKAGTILYAMGITQFTHGSENVRAIAILQLLLGNMGIPGGGVNAQRGQQNVQGSTDMAILYHIMPGYIGHPKAAAHPTLQDYIEKETPATGYWSNKPKFLISMLKAFWGDKATAANDFCYDYYPKLDAKNRSHIGMYKYMGEGEIKGMICWADNPAVSGPSASSKRGYTGKLDWQVMVDIFENETATFWKEPGKNPAEIGTEVFLLPAALHIERDGTVANSGRWIQWRNKAYESPGDCKPDLWIVDKLYKAIRKAYEEDPGPFADPILNLNWDYGDEIDIAKVCKEINGYNTNTGDYVTNFTELADDGSTACGCWIFSGYYNSDNDPPCKRRTRETEGIGTNANWSFAWPLNRRIIYNRCSSDPSGRPWNPDIPLLWYENGEWKRNDVPDFNANVPPENTARGPFIMNPELQARFFAPGMAEGPFPEHYEPWESPVDNAMSSIQYNPAITVWYPDAHGDKEQYPYIATSYRMTEHYQTSVVTRNLPWLNELMPELFVEISPSLAEKIGIKNGDRVIVESKRGQFEAPACVTSRLQPLIVNGTEQEIVGMFWHWGYACMSKGPIANDITPSIGCANTDIPEYKAFLCNIKKAG